MGCCRSRQHGRSLKVIDHHGSEVTAPKPDAWQSPVPTPTETPHRITVSQCDVIAEDETESATPQGRGAQSVGPSRSFYGGSRGTVGTMSMARKFRDSLASLVSVGTFRVHHEHFVMMQPGKITEHWRLIKEDQLGKGAAGSVCKAECKHQKGLMRAVKKCFKVRERDEKALHREVNIMKLMDHPNVIRLFEVFEDRRCMYFVLELCVGGELLKHIVQTESVTEKDSCSIVKQILRGVSFMHEKHVAHRDLKPENFLLEDSNMSLQRSTLKIIDFGCAAQVLPGTCLNTRAGTPFYMAPEMLLGDNRHDLSCDNWSIGVVAFFLLSGELPFHANDQESVFELVRKAAYSLSGKIWQYRSDSAKDLLGSFLTKDRHKRITAQKALQDLWIKKNAHGSVLSAPPGLLDHLRDFQQSSRLKKAALHSVAHQITTKNIHQLESAFLEMDENGDGCVTLDELEQALEKMGANLSPDQLRSLAETVDTDGDGQVGYTEFIAATVDLHSQIQEDVLWSAFCSFDKNGDGKISEAELAQILEFDDVQNFLQETITSETVKAMIEEADVSKDGFIDFEEFLQLTRSSEPSSQGLYLSDGQMNSTGVDSLAAKISIEQTTTIKTEQMEDVIPAKEDVLL